MSRTLSSTDRGAVIGCGGALPSIFGLDTPEGHIGPNPAGDDDGLIRTDPVTGERLDAPSAKLVMPASRLFFKADHFGSR